jgi:hypothetical protein
MEDGLLAACPDAVAEVLGTDLGDLEDDDE